ncbi:heavy metal-associated isoprenylated plant protein 39-like [Cryptomeria japonica]|uniref:heavy metal-associated isoprenylated plant protein 39-like n=1 Tax=Cryptomeria japonica TaxID=3369 RepID=UPI0027DA0DA0|nr:heavy metal-associated isoprenylated plant protein 39-like [Cryptomeria japonica]
MKKMVLKSSIEDEKSKKKALKAVAGLEGVDSVAVDMKEKKITVIGAADPVFLTSKLRKFAYTELLTVGPTKEEKKEAPKQEQKKEEKKTEPPATIFIHPSSYSYSHDHRPYQDPEDSDEYSYCTIC